MKKRKTQTGKTAQEMQDQIFRKMTADKKIEVGSLLWQWGKSLAGDKINYASKRSQTSFGRYRQNT